MKILKVRLYIKSKDKTGEIVSILKNYGIDTKNFFTHLKEKGYFEFNIEDKLLEEILGKLEDFVDTQIVNPEYNKDSQRMDGKVLKTPYGLLSLLIFDVFIIITMIEIFSKSIDLNGLISSIISINRLSSIVEILIKIFLSFVLIRGTVQLSETTFLGRNLGVKIDGLNNFILLMLLLVISYYLLGSYLAILRYFGLFLIVFIFIAIFFSYENLGISLKREKY